LFVLKERQKNASICRCIFFVCFKGAAEKRIDLPLHFSADNLLSQIVDYLLRVLTSLRMRVK
jgi:hypothetical protein